MAAATAKKKNAKGGKSTQNKGARRGASQNGVPAPRQSSLDSVLSAKALTERQQQVLDDLGQEALVEMYRQMYRIRAFEQRCEQGYQQRKIGGFLHLYMGQEAVAVGMLHALREDDYVVQSYRDHGTALALGLDANVLMAELFGKATGISQGKGGSMHFYSREKNFLGGQGIVGGQIPLGLGAAFTASYLQTDRVAVCFLGDGAVQQGSFHESLNMAALWHLPCLFVVENNLYGMGTSVQRASAVLDFTTKGPGYNTEAVWVNGMNMLDCYAAMKDAAEVRRTEPRPILMQVDTYRYRGHSISDPARYRTKEETENYQRVDPIEQVKRLLIELKWLSEDDAKETERAVRKEMADAYEFADQSPQPELEALQMHVYAD